MAKGTVKCKKCHFSGFQFYWDDWERQNFLSCMWFPFLEKHLRDPSTSGPLKELFTVQTVLSNWSPSRVHETKIGQCMRLQLLFMSLAHICYRYIKERCHECQNTCQLWKNQYLAKRSNICMMNNIHSTTFSGAGSEATRKYGPKMLPQKRDSPDSFSSSLGLTCKPKQTERTPAHKLS